jgi:soluble lytic murein transglycosylase-like protein
MPARLTAVLCGALALVGLACTPQQLASALPSADARTRTCPGYEHLLAEHGLPVAHFSKIMYRESGCQPGARSRSRDSGLLQINDVNHRWLSQRLGTPVTSSWLMDAENNVRAAAELYDVYGTRPWRATR